MNFSVLTSSFQALHFVGSLNLSRLSMSANHTGPACLCAMIGIGATLTHSEVRGRVLLRGNAPLGGGVGTIVLSITAMEYYCSLNRFSILKG